MFAAFFTLCYGKNAALSKKVADGCAKYTLRTNEIAEEHDEMACCRGKNAEGGFTCIVYPRKGAAERSFFT